VGYGKSPLVRTLRLAYGSAPPSGKVRRQGGDGQEDSISGCVLGRDHTPQSGLKKSAHHAQKFHFKTLIDFMRVNGRGLHRVKNFVRATGQGRFALLMYGW